MLFVATGLKDVVTSDDGKEVTFTILLQYAPEMVFTMPAAAFESFRVLQSSVPPPDQAGQVSAAAKKGRKVLHKPKKWILGAEAKNNIVALIFDPHSERETAFALSVNVARDLAAGLTKTADTLANNKPAKPH
jgi:hypothetical protein